MHEHWARTTRTIIALSLSTDISISIPMYQRQLKDAQKGLRTIFEEMDVVVEGLEYFLHDPSETVYQDSIEG